MKVFELFESSTNEAGKTEKFDPDHDKMIGLIKRDCGPFLKAARKPLYRGMTRKKNARFMTQVMRNFYKCSVRPDRKPRDMGPKTAQAFDNMFVSKIGVPLRTASLFCTTNRNTASGYSDSEPALIFPIGEFHYAWSPVMKDAYAAIIDYDKSIVKLCNKYGKEIGLSADAISNLPAREFNTILNIALEKYGHELYLFDKGLNASDGHELMIVCDKYYAVFLYNLGSEKHFWERVKSK